MSFLRGPLLNPQPDGTVQYLPDALVHHDRVGRITWVGAWERCPAELREPARHVPRIRGILAPPLLDLHLHLPQHPIRGRFTEGVSDPAPEGWLAAGLWRNVFPQEARAEQPDYARQVVREFLEDTHSNGVIGGSAYMTVHAPAARAALVELPESWWVGLVLMDQNCPAYLRTDPAAVDREVAALAEEFGPRLVVTDRFAVSVSSALRRRGAALAARHGLRMQTHLNEQIPEKRLVEEVLYPGVGSYTELYRRDGLLDHAPILAHSVWSRPEEWELLARYPAAIAHCPVSNALLGSGIMPLDRMLEHGIPYALCTDVGASPSTSLLVEMAQFLLVHHGRSRHATPSAALWHATLGPVRIMSGDADSPVFAPGRLLTCIELDADPPPAAGWPADEVILRSVLRTSAAELSSQADRLRPALERLQAGACSAADRSLLRENVDADVRRLEQRVTRVLSAGSPVWQRPAHGGC